MKTINEMSKNIARNIKIGIAIFTVCTIGTSIFTNRFGMLWIIFFLYDCLGFVYFVMVRCEDYHDLCEYLFENLPKRLSMRTFKKAGFEYCIVDDKIEIIVEKMIINNQVFDIISDWKEIKKMLKMYDIVHVQGEIEENSLYSKTPTTIFSISSKQLSDQFKRGEYICQVPVKSIFVRNRLIPNKQIRFINKNNNDEQMLDRIMALDKKDFVYAMFKKKKARLKNDLSAFDSFDFKQAKVGQEWQPLDSCSPEHILQEIHIAQNKHLQTLQDCSISRKIQEIDQKLDNGYVFKTISINRYKDGYKKECLNMLNLHETLTEKEEKDIMEILEKLENDLINVKNAEQSLQKEITIKAMQDLLKFDGIDGKLKMEL